MRGDQYSVQIAAMEMAILVLKNKIWDLRAEQHRAEVENGDTEDSEEDSSVEPPPKSKNKDKDKDKDIWVEITGGIERTLFRKAKVVKETKAYYWLLDGVEPMYRRLKSNTKRYNFEDDSDNDTVIYE